MSPTVRKARRIHDRLVMGRMLDAIDWSDFPVDKNEPAVLTHPGSRQARR